MSARTSQSVMVQKAGDRERRLPAWLRSHLPAGPTSKRFRAMRATVETNRLHTVCEAARCPNIYNCWGCGTATFMVAGNTCTRTCRFCAIPTLRDPPLPDADEPAHLAAAVAQMDLAHVVITVVNRDDLPDGGAGHYRRCLAAVHSRAPQVRLELLCSDLGGDADALAFLLAETPLAVFAHNVECVPRLDRAVRDRRASFTQSLVVLENAKRLCPSLLTKSSLMLGLGETDAEVAEALRRVRDVGVDILTMGQYLPPTFRHHPVDRYVVPERFDLWDRQARALGFKAVASGPMVRSSYHAGRLFDQACTGRRDLS